MVKWEAWDYQLDLLDLLLKYNDIVILKARQLGVSWLVTGYGIWKALFNEAAKILLLSQGEEEAWELLDKGRYMWRKLPEVLRCSAKSDTKGMLCFGSNDSVLHALPSTDKAGRGTDATVIIRDELAKHPYGRDNFIAISPAIDSGGQIIDVSTINKYDSESHFTQRVNRALNGAAKHTLPSGLEYYTGGESGACLIFLGWRLRPVREEGLSLEEWFKAKVVPKYDPIAIEQEYPETLEEALSVPKTTCCFDVTALNAMLLECVSPLREEQNGIIKIFRESVAGRRYAFIIDPSEGVDDPACGAIIDWRTDETVAVFEGKIPIDEQARIIYSFWEKYNRPYIVPERNASGLALINKLVDMGINTFHYYDKEKKKAGWWTSVATRPVMLVDLSEMVRLRQFRIPQEHMVRQFLSFVRTDKNPDGVAVKGKHDDWVMLYAIYWQVKKHVPVGEVQIHSYTYRE